jgi:hypothetical protein
LILINEKEKNSLFIFIMFILSNFILQQTKHYREVEWQRGFQSLIGSCHPNIWTFLGKLKRQQSLHHIQLTQILAGDVIPQRKKYQDAAIRVLHLLQNYGNRHVLDFLCGVAYNIHM